MTFQLKDKVKIVGILEDLYVGWIWEIIQIETLPYPDATGSRTFYCIFNPKSENGHHDMTKSVQRDEIELLPPEIAFSKPFDFLK